MAKSMGTEYRGTTTAEPPKSLWIGSVRVGKGSRCTACSPERVSHSYDIMNSQGNIIVRIWWSLHPRLCWSRDTTCWTAKPTWDWGGDETAGHRNFDILWGSRYHLFGDSRNGDSLGFVVIRRGDDLLGSEQKSQCTHHQAHLNDLIARKGEERNISSVASHEITIEDSKNAFMGNNEQVILLSFKLKYDRLQSHCEVMIRLDRSVGSSNLSLLELTYFGTRISMMIWIEFMFCDFIWILFSYTSF